MPALISKERVSNRLWLGGLAAAAFLLEFIPNLFGGYGYFIDEFYYIACAVHPAFGYVDHPPLAPLILTAFSFLFGTSLAARATSSTAVSDQRPGGTAPTRP